jgi:dihydroxyacetone kinase-like predicted kinase
VEPEYLDGTLFLNALRHAAGKLYEKRQDINQINVFPVPDGDTGNNMLATVEDALFEAEKITPAFLGKTVAAAWTGAREGSTGNSGAIFAQYLKGWAAVFSGLEKADADTVAQAMAQGTQEAYGAVLKPAEGTILTVAREAALAAKKASAGGGMKDTLTAAYAQAKKTLVQTSKLLPALRSRRIVDAGGWGLLIFFSAVLKAMGISIKSEFDFKARINFFERLDAYRFKNPFDMEFSVRLKADREGVLRLAIGEFGTELITQTNGEICQVHIHTQSPLMVAERVAELGDFSDLTIRDMRSQYADLADKNEKKYHTIALGKSPGFIAMFAMAGAQIAVSVANLKKKERLLRACGEDALLISCKETDLTFFKSEAVVLEDEARVLAALVSLYGSEKPGDEAVRAAAGYPRNADIVKLGYTYEARSDGKIIAKGGLKETLARAVAFLKPKSGEMLTVYYGRPGGRQELEAFLPYLSEEFDTLEGIELYFGGQKTPLMVSLE